MKCQVSYALAAGLMVAASSASALPTVFNDSVPDGISTFDSTVATAGGTVNTDKLTGLTSGNTWVRTDYTITSTSGSTRSIDPSYPGLTGQSIGINPTSPAPGSGLTFTFSSPINAFGLEVGDWATCCYLPSSLYISFDGGATQTVAQAYSSLDNPGYVKEGVYANFVGAVDDTATFSTITFYGDGFGEYLTAGGTIRFAVVPIGSFTGPSFNPQPLVTNSITSLYQQTTNIFHRLTGRLHGLDNQYRKETRGTQASLQQTPTEALALVASAASGESGTAQYLSEAAYSALAQPKYSGVSYANGDGTGWQQAMDFFKIGGVRGFIKAQYSLGSRDPVGTQDGFDFKGWTVTAGADRNIKENLIVGVALGYSQQNSDADIAQFEVDSKTWIFSLFSSWAPYPNVYVDTALSYGNASHTTKRKAAADDPFGDSVGKPDSTNYLAAISIGKIFGYRDYNYGPFAGLQWARTKVDSYDEVGGSAPLSVSSQTGNSFTAHVGMQGAWTLTKPTYILTPQVSVAVEHEFKDDNRTILSGPVGGAQNPLTIIGQGADTYARLNLGVSFANKDKPRSFRLDYDGLFGRDKLNAHAITARFRWAFD